MFEKYGAKVVKETLTFGTGSQNEVSDWVLVNICYEIYET